MFFEPVAFSIGPVVVRWYSLAYLFGGVLCAVQLHLFMRLRDHPLPRNAFTLADFFAYGMMGVIIGGRLGYIFFYHFTYYLQHPLSVFALWEGGMSFHGGALGALTAYFIFARRYRISYWALMDAVAASVPAGLFLGRLANFVNAELYGYPSAVPWAIVFPNAGDFSRHPSQLYEALGEGLLLWGILVSLYAVLYRRSGMTTALFAIFYAIIRFGLEFFREPDAHLALFFNFFTMGQLLCIVCLALGLVLFGYHYMRHRALCVDSSP